MVAPKKPIDVRQKLYHYFKLSSVKYILFDDLMDMPIQYGSLDVMTPAVESVKKNVPGAIIIYYDRDTKYAFKKNDMKCRVNNKR